VEALSNSRKLRYYCLFKQQPYSLFCVLLATDKNGDYQESWQPARISDKELYEAQDMAEKVTEALGGAGLFGVEFS
jgi:phosphoribosylglycinamide formyltransferase 2